MQAKEIQSENKGKPCTKIKIGKSKTVRHEAKGLKKQSRIFISYKGCALYLVQLQLPPHVLLRGMHQFHIVLSNQGQAPAPAPRPRSTARPVHEVDGEPFCMYVCMYVVQKDRRKKREESMVRCVVKWEIR